MNDLSALQKIQAVKLSSEVIDPFEYAEYLVSEGIIKPNQKSETAAIVLTTPTSLFLYDGVRLFIQKILQAGSDVVLWTQGNPQLQTAKCDTSGLPQLSAHTQGAIKISAGEDKISLLDGLLTAAHTHGKKRIVIIDDKSNQLFRTYQDILKLIEVDHRNLPADILYRWARYDIKTKNLFPPGFPTLTELTSFIKADFKTITSLDEIPVFANTLYLTDLDRTLVDTDKWFLTVIERIATEICLH